MTSKTFSAIAVSWVIALCIGLFVTIGPSQKTLMSMSLWPQRDPLLLRIHNECKRLYGDHPAFDGCFRTLWARHTAETIRDKMDTAYQRTR
jgi:hypothetical protein